MLPYTFQHTANLPAFRKALFPALPIFQLLIWISNLFLLYRFFHILAMFFPASSKKASFFRPFAESAFRRDNLRSAEGAHEPLLIEALRVSNPDGSAESGHSCRIESPPRPCGAPRAPCNDRRSRWTAGNPASLSARFRPFHGDPPFRDIRPPIQKDDMYPVFWTPA